MLKNYLISTFRYLLKRRAYFVINTMGLAIGLASFLVIYLYNADELSYDRQHRNAGNIYRLVNVYDFEGVGENSASSPFPVAFTLLSEFPASVRNVVRIYNFQAPRSFVEYGDHKFNEKNFFFADSTYFSIFDHEFVEGNPATALNESGSVVITRSTAERYFGNNDPIGKVINFESSLGLKVTAVIEDVSEQSHFRFDFLASMSTLRKVYGGRLPQTWVWNPCWTYLLLDEKADPKAMERKFPAFIDKYFYDAEKDNVSLYLQPLKDIHLKSKLDYEITPNSDINSVRVLWVIAAFLLVIAIINYMNLATATSARRMKEIGIKKVAGASRFQLIVQFLGESLIFAIIAAVIALILIELILPVFNTFTQKNILFYDLLAPRNIVLVFVLILVVGLLSGFYPAFYLSAMDPLKVLKTKLANTAKSGMARKVLVVLQFTISISLIIATVSIRDQLNYMRNADLGFHKKDILVLPINRTPIMTHYDEYRKMLLQSPLVTSVTAMDDIFGAAHNTHEFRPEGFPDDHWQFYPAMVVQYDFLKTFDIPLVAGRDYNEANKTDPETGIIINEAMVRHMGWNSPQDALGKQFRSLNGNERVIGVFRDFHQTSLHEQAGPFVINMKELPAEINWFLKYIVIRIEPGSDKNALAYIEKTWHELAPERPFEYFYLESALNDLYKDEENLSKLSLLFTFIVMFIAALGLIGLASFMAEQRTKEIGIRKVLGASTLSIIQGLTSEFVILVSLASIVAWILSYLIMDDWLSRFPYHASINWFFFILATGIAYVLAIAITSFRAMMASKANPVTTLKYE